MASAQHASKGIWCSRWQGRRTAAGGAPGSRRHTAGTWRRVVGLLGPNGAGKSTLRRMVAMATPPTSGHTVVAGYEVTGTIAERTAARLSIGYLPQESTFPPGMTAFAFVDRVLDVVVLVVTTK